jgi:hypothetical protein
LEAVRICGKTRIAPALATPAPATDVKQGDNAPSARSKNKFVQLER